MRSAPLIVSAQRNKCRTNKPLNTYLITEKINLYHFSFIHVCWQTDIFLPGFEPFSSLSQQINIPCHEIDKRNLYISINFCLYLHGSEWLDLKFDAKIQRFREKAKYLSFILLLESTFLQTPIRIPFNPNRSLENLKSWSCL